jgi:hypothetical protein
MAWLLSVVHNMTRITTSNPMTPYHTASGLPSGRALLPETLDSADEEASALSPARYYDAGATPSGGAGALAATRWRQQQQQIEAQVEKEFFEVINRDTQVRMTLGWHGPAIR